jgi:hypothetical protein
LIPLEQAMHFLDKTPICFWIRHRQQKQKIDKWDYIKLKTRRQPM